jgi:hypothetical protein
MVKLYNLDDGVMQCKPVMKSGAVGAINIIKDPREKKIVEALESKRLPFSVWPVRRTKEAVNDGRIKANIKIWMAA